MQFRRWWPLLALTLVLSPALPARLGYAQAGGSIGTSVTPAVTASMSAAEQAKAVAAVATELANAKDNAAASNARLRLLAPIDANRGNAGFLFSYGGMLGNSVGDILIKGKAVPNHVALHAAMTLAQAQIEMTRQSKGGNQPVVVALDPKLAELLRSEDPAVRYWAAKGLSAAIPALKAQGIRKGVTDALKALSGAVGKETDPVAKAQMLRALGPTGAVQVIGPVLGDLANTIQKKAPGVTDLMVAAAGLESLAEAIPAAGADLKEADLVTALSAAANLTSFIVQHNAANNLAPGLGAQVFAAADAGIRAFKATGKVSIPNLPATAKGDDLYSAVSNAVGSVSSGPGQLQKAFPKVPTPPSITTTAAQR